MPVFSIRKMAANKLRLADFRLFPKLITNSVKQRLFFCTNTSSEKESGKKGSTFAQFYEKQLELKEKSETPPQTKPEPTQTFASLLRNSKFVDLGDPEGKMVIGTIYHVVGDDLYIDFGWKFPTVCSKPRNNKHLYVEGAKVILSIKDLELSTRFLGSTTDMTLLEADCVLHGLAN